MKTTISFAIFILMSLRLEATDGLTIRPDQAHYIKDGLAINIALVDNPYKFLEEWSKPSFPDTPIIKTRTIFHRGEIVFPAITYSTDSLDSDGKANITFDLLILRPDGSIYIDNKDKTVADSAPPHGFGLVKDQIALKIETKDAFGKYKIKITIHDNIKKVSFDIPMDFEVAP